MWLRTENKCKVQEIRYVFIDFLDSVFFKRDTGTEFLHLVTLKEKLKKSTVTSTQGEDEKM